MAITRFQDLPSENTPINSEHLNGNFDELGVKVGTSVDNNYRTNILHSRNLFDGIIEQGGFNASGLPQDNNTRVRSTNFIAVKPNTTYTATVPRNMKVIVEFYNANTSSSTIIGQTDGWVNVERTFTTPANTNYIKLLIGKQNDSNLTPSEVTNVMLNIGVTALAYEPYIASSIIVDGETIVSKNTYSTNEAVIGEWFGKPLYRKVFNFDNPASGSSLGSSGILPANVTKIDALGTQANANIGGRIPLGYGGFGVQIDANGNFYYSNPNYTFSNLSITVEYIKTTDTATRSLNTIEQTRSIPTESTQDDER